LSSNNEHTTQVYGFCTRSLSLLGILFWVVCDELSWLILHEGWVEVFLHGEDNSRENPDQEDIQHSCKASYFSKRRRGVFKKAHELSDLCDAEIALMVFTAMASFLSSQTQGSSLFHFLIISYFIMSSVIPLIILAFIIYGFLWTNKIEKEENEWNGCTIESLDMCEQNNIFRGKRREELREKLALMLWRFWCQLLLVIASSNPFTRTIGTSTYGILLIYGLMPSLFYIYV